MATNIVEYTTPLGNKANLTNGEGISDLRTAEGEVSNHKKRLENVLRHSMQVCSMFKNDVRDVSEAKGRMQNLEDETRANLQAGVDLFHAFFLREETDKANKLDIELKYRVDLAQLAHAALSQIVNSPDSALKDVDRFLTEYTSFSYAISAEGKIRLESRGSDNSIPNVKPEERQKDSDADPNSIRLEKNTKLLQSKSKEKKADEAIENVFETINDPFANKTTDRVKGAFASNVYNCGEDTSYYRKFPPPWNIPPNTPVSQNFSPYKAIQNGLIQKFNGDCHNYISWRNTFISAVHETVMPEKMKFVSLKACIEPSCKKIIEMLNNLPHNSKGYFMGITDIELEFGNVDDLVTMKRAEIQNIPIVYYKDIDNLHELIRKTTSYVILLEDLNYDHEVSSIHLFQDVLGRLSDGLQLKYFEYREEQKLRKDMRSLLLWANRYYKLMSSVKSTKQLTSKKSVYNTTTESMAPAAACEPAIVVESSTVADVDDEHVEVEQYELEEEHALTIALSKVPDCDACEGKHYFKQCDIFMDMSIKQRREHINVKKRCFKCLRQGHMASNCPTKIKCKKCLGAHNQLLHLDKEKSINTVVDETEIKQFVGHAKSDDDEINFSIRTIPVRITNKDSGKSRTINALLDEGATVSLISTDIYNHLGLKGRPIQFYLNTAGGQRTEHNSIIANAFISNPDGSYKRSVSLQTIDTPVGNYTPIDWSIEAKQWKHLENITFPPPVKCPNTIEMIIGIDNAFHIRSLVEVAGGEDEPVARKTPLGWTVGGRSDATLEMKESTCYFSQIERSPASFISNLNDKFACSTTANPKIECNCAEQNSVLDKALKNYWLVENLHVKKSEMLTNDEKRAIELLSTSKQTEKGKYIVSVLWKNDNSTLENNYRQAKNRLISLLKSKMFRNDDVLKRYEEVIQTWLEKGYIETVNGVEATKGYFLPHFPVIRQDKATTKLRIVMDGAAKFNGKSLNDEMLSGPSFMNDIATVLLRFRKKKVAITGDICEMFLRIGLTENDKRFHRFIWQKNDKFQTYQFCSHVFGNAGSPSIAMHTIRMHAMKYKDLYPEAVDTILNSTIVDDNLDSVDTVEEAIQRIKELSQIYAECDMVIRKWCSNDSRALINVKKEDQASGIVVEDVGQMSILPQFKTLGVTWDAQTDVFKFQLETPTVGKWTKRAFASTYAKLFDPLGMVSPFVIKARILFQKCWKNQIGWDDPVPEPILSQWKEWLDDLNKLNGYTIPRCLDQRGSIKCANRTSLHIFCDASSDAFAAVAYTVTKKDSESISVLTLSRARVAPIIYRSIPRLELDAAVLAADLMKACNDVMELPAENVFLWTDSTDVLCWLRSPSRSLHIYVANRIGYLHNNTPITSWRWVPSNLNPADAPSRGSSAKELKENKLWQNGPEFIRQTEDKWPLIESRLSPSKDAEKEIKDDILSQTDRLVLQTTIEKESKDSFCKSMAMRYSRFSKLRRVVAYCLRWRYRMVSNQRKLRSSRKDSIIESPTAHELQRAETALVRAAQQDSFPEIYSNLQNSENVPLENKLSAFRPGIDDKGCIRVYGRLQKAAHLDYNMKCPLILCPKHDLTKLIIRHIHEVEAKHSDGLNQTMALVHKKYWILKLNALVRKTLRSCYTCKLKNAFARRSRQIMSPLPDFRINNSDKRLPPFHCVGIDCAGPFFVKMGGKGRALQKRWIALYTCAQYRAVHLEMLYGMDCSSFLNSFTRFVSRRPRPKIVVTDNGGNFIKANKELRCLLENIDIDRCKIEYPSIEWKLNPPYSPNHGGFFERLIGSCKRSLSAVIQRGTLTDEEFNTALVTVESMLNNRPISRVQNSPNDLEALTPNHFLANCTLLDLAPIPEDQSWPPNQRWHFLQGLSDKIWRRFIVEVVPHLNKYTKWPRKVKDYKVGDIVLVLQDERGIWPLGRVEKVYPSEKDGHIRILDIKYLGKTRKTSISNVMHFIDNEM